MTADSGAGTRSRAGDGASNGHRDYWSTEFRRLVTLGESTTAGGWSSSGERCWASRLAALINDVQDEPVELFNAGIGANVISTESPCYTDSGKPAASERIDKHVIARDPDLLIISYGINDARGGTPLWLFIREMAKIIDRIRDHIAPVIILVGPYFNTRFDLGGDRWSHANLETFVAFNEGIAGVAREKKCLFADVMSGYGGAPWLVHFDGVHANDVGHLVVANRIFEVIAQNCSGISVATKRKERTIPPWRDESSLAADYGVERGPTPVPR